MKKEFVNKYNFNIDSNKPITNEEINDTSIEKEKEKEKVDFYRSFKSNDSKTNLEKNKNEKFIIIENQDFTRENLDKNINEFEEIKVYYESFTAIEKEKIKIDNLNSFGQLKKRIEVNKKIFSIFIDNYYLDDFNNSRRGLYSMFSLPFITFFGLLMMNPFHPLRRPLLLITILGPSFYTLVSFKSDVENLSAKNTILGMKVIFYNLSLFFL
jgi:hypothetical protein